MPPSRLVPSTVYCSPIFAPAMRSFAPSVRLTTPLAVLEDNAPSGSSAASALTTSRDLPEKSSWLGVKVNAVPPLEVLVPSTTMP